MKEEKDDTYKYMFYFMLVWFMVIIVILPLVDIYLLDKSILKSMCSSNLVIPIGDNIKHCEELLGENTT